MNIEFKREIQVTVYGVIGELYFEEERPVYKNLLAIGRESTISVKNLQSFFSNYDKEIRSIIISRILNYLKDNMLIDSSGNLTTAGEEVIETGKFKIFEKGKYRIWCIDDDLIGQKILHFERADNDSYRTYYNFPLKEIVGVEHVDLIDGNKFYFDRFSRDKIDYKIIEGFDSKILLIWSLELKNNEIESHTYTLKGSISSTKRYDRAMTKYDIDETLEMDETFEDALNISELMNNIFLDEFHWDDDKSGILLEFDEIPERTFETFKIDLHFKEREILNYGVFEEVELFDIRVIPSNLTTSLKWLKKNIQKTCKKDYVTPLEFNNFVKKFKDLDEIEYYRDEIKLTTEILIKEYQNNNLIEEYWHLQASIDLYIEEN